jgi:hypothetical protein
VEKANARLDPSSSSPVTARGMREGLRAEVSRGVRARGATGEASLLPGIAPVLPALDDAAGEASQALLRLVVS